MGIKRTLWDVYGRYYDVTNRLQYEFSTSWEVVER